MFVSDRKGDKGDVLENAGRMGGYISLAYLDLMVADKGQVSSLFILTLQETYTPRGYC